MIPWDVKMSTKSSRHGWRLVVKLGVSRIAGHVKRRGRRFGKDHHGLYNVVMQDKLKHVSREISQSGAVS